MLMVEHKHTRNVISRTRLSNSLTLSRSPYSAHTLTYTLSSSLLLFVRPDIIKENINNSVCGEIKIPQTPTDDGIIKNNIVV